jgi:hypothetical protein
MWREGLIDVTAFEKAEARSRDDGDDVSEKKICCAMDAALRIEQWTSKVRSMISKELECGKPIVVLVSINAAVGALWGPYVSVLVNIAPHREKETRLPRQVRKIVCAPSASGEKPFSHPSL